MMRTVTYKLDDLKDVVIHIGRAEENLATSVRIDAGKVFAEYPAAVPTMKVINPAGTVYGREVSRDGDLVIWDVTESDLAAEGQGEMQLTFTEGSVIVKSADARTEVCRSIVGGTTPPDPVQDWIDRAEEVLEEVEDAFPTGGTTGQVLAKKSNADFDTEWVDQGSGGTVNYNELENKPQIGGVTLTGNKSLHDLGAAAESDIPDVSGFYTKPAGGIPASDIADGVIPDPEDLIDDTAGEGDTDKTWSADKLTSDVLSAIQQKYTLPSDGIPSTDLASGVQTSLGKADTAYQKPSTGIPASDIASGVIPSVPVQDVQVNGSSILNNGVANVPIASDSAFGVAKYEAWRGININANGFAYLNSATDGVCKAGTDEYRPITAGHQNASTFYGLATAAGDATQASSSNPVGTYTEDAKRKITDMIEPQFRKIAEITTENNQGVVYINTDLNGDPFELTDVIIDLNLTVASGNAKCVIVVNQPDSASDTTALYTTIPNLCCDNTFNNSSARRNVERIWIDGGRFFGISQDGAFANYSGSGQLRVSLASSGIISVDKIRSLRIYAHNLTTTFGNNSVITIYGR